ncbi:LysR family transcriptional regulator [Acerihabitans arboris]|uniref:LysR family transcriptional regulator n=1 Tax=Acerihabitans arboris TaxID=2691583 RepID=A0A845SRE7_9GAMM|nr:LysR family transcriptional regulator [Acerihabitans arboris]NDL63705.1 LysR family transcriptional regulator [Acerihabitans arboris]
MIPTERLKGLTAFVYAARHGSFASAAEQLNLTSSAVGKSVARLEQRLDTRLFERTTRRLRLTDAGQAFYETCTRVLNDLAEAQAVLASHAHTPMGRLRIDLPASFGRMIVMPVLIEFCRRHANLRPHITFTDRFVDLADEGVDVAVRIGGIGDLPPTVGHRYLGTERLVFCAAPSYLAKRGVPLSADQLGEYDCVVYGKGDGAGARWSLPADGERAEPLAVAHHMMLGDSEAQVAALEAGAGIAQMATWLVNDSLNRGTLVRILPEVSVDGLPLHIIWPKNKQLTPKIDLLLQTFAEQLRIR